jgi:hypothetical protein
MDNEKTPKINNKYYCEKCDFTCSKNNEYMRHLSTAKHKRSEMDNEKTPKNATPYMCSCGNEYNHASGLSKHKKKCTYIQNSSKKETEVSEDMSKPTMENYLKLMKQNTELHEVVKQSNEIIKQQSGLMQQQMEVSKQQVEVSNKQSGLIQQQMENTEEILDTVKNAKGNTINNNININFFLNDTCKDAMNIADFIDTLKIGMGDLDNFGKGGFIEGVSNVIIKRLNELEVAERPIHCTDLKRKSLYLKDKDTWNKEEPGMNNMKKMIDSVRHKNMMKLPEWQEENPSSRVLSTSKHREYMTIANKVMGGGTDAEDEHNYKSIINKVSGATVLSKNDTVVDTDTCMIVTDIETTK